MKQEIWPIDEEFRIALKELKKEKKLTNKELGNIASVSDRFIQMIIAGERGAGKETSEKIAAHFGLSYNDMLKIGRHKIEGKDQQSVAIQSRYSKDIRLVSIPLLNSTVSAGHHIATVEGAREMIQMPESIVGRKTSEALAMIIVRGDSMEPALKDGDVVILDGAQNTLDGGGIFVIAVGERLAVKRLQPTVDGKIVIRSDNPAYAAETVLPDQVHIKGRVIWYGRKMG